MAVLIGAAFLLELGMNPIYAIGDIHGHLDKLDEALERIQNDGGADATVVFVGDYVDRGAQSKDVIQRIIDGQASGKNWIALKGNHDRMFELFMQSPPQHDPQLLLGMDWFNDRIGGITTLESYGVEIEREISRTFQVHAQAIDCVPAAHIAFLKSLNTYYLVGETLFVHAGIRPEIPLSAQAETDLLWIRKEFHDYQDDHEYLIVHGHTPVKNITHYGNRVNIDGGAAYGRELTPVVIEGAEICALGREGRVRLYPIK
jgi:serine/threonine protein phosphatase 1